MPLPTPNPDEPKEDFIDRCMADDTMNQDFPDQSQRRAVCENQFEGQAPLINYNTLSMPYENVARAVFGEPWAITQPMFDVICGIVRRRITSGKLTAEEIQQEIGAAAPRRQNRQLGDIGVLALHGPIAQRMNLMMQFSGGTSTQIFESEFLTMMQNPNIASIVIDVESPGGNVEGVQELHDTIMAHRGQKPVVAVANSTMASAAYWIGSAADEIVVTPGGQVGSIGVLAAHEDLSAKLEMDGINTTLFTAGKKKSHGHPFGPISEEAAADIQAKVDTYYSMFTNAVAKGRGVNVTQVRNGFGEGGMVLAGEAVRLGMADRVATLNQTIQRMAGVQSGTRSVGAEDHSFQFTAEGIEMIEQKRLLEQQLADRYIGSEKEVPTILERRRQLVDNS